MFTGKYHKVSWIKDLDEGTFKEFILSQYEEWLEDFQHINCERIEKNPDNDDHWERGKEISEEIIKVRGMY